MFSKRVVVLALASSAIAQTSGMDMPGMDVTTPAVAESESSSQTSLVTDSLTGGINTVSTATDIPMPTSMETSMPAEMSTAPSSEEVAGQSTSMTTDNTLSTYTTSAAGMNHSGMPGMGGTHNTTDTTGPPISGSGVNGVSVALFAVSVALGAVFQL
ncbi:hypothetical protein DL771_002887 [Monosporascus sp. 5C6A]|nr:hypothetical protein DL771_002887 [Monosporascus sp. 5C6A]